MRDEFQQRSDFLASDLQSKEERLSQAQRAVLAAQTNKHASLSSNESPVDTFSHNDVVLLAKAGTTEPIKLRPNVHFYPATIPSPAKELGAVSPTSPLHEFDDETALYPPPAESPPSSPAVNIREGEPLIYPLFIDEDSNAPANKNMAKPPLSPKAKAVNSENCRNSKYKSPLDLYKKVGSNHRKDYVLLEINIADGKQRSLRIDTDTQPLVTFLICARIVAEISFASTVGTGIWLPGIPRAEPGIFNSIDRVHNTDAGNSDTPGD